MSDSWEIITAISTATTAILAAFTYGLVRWQWHLNNPTVGYGSSCDTRDNYGTITFTIEDSEKKKWFLKEVKVINPKSARISVPVSSPENIPVPGEWSKKLTFEAQTLSTGIYFTAESEAEVTFKVCTCLKVKPSKKLIHKITVKMHKYEKP